MLSGLVKDLPFRMNARRVCRKMKLHKWQEKSNVLKINLPEYHGSNICLIGLRQQLLTIRNELVTVLIHGSQADGLTTGYSDVDALVVLRNEVFHRPDELARIAAVLSDSRKWFHQIDPLQHHGWFVAVESDFNHYSEKILPLEVIKEAVVLLGDRQLEFRYQSHDRQHYVKMAHHILNHLEDKLSKLRLPNQLFAFKSLLSEFMMLPVLYRQAKTGQGCSKRDSFKLAATDFTEREWAIMEKVSAVRKEWKFKPANQTKKILLSTSGFSWKLRKKWPISVPDAIKNQFDDNSCLEMLHFIRTMRASLEQLK